MYINGKVLSNNFRNKQNGFSLIEIAVILVIIGLIIGGAVTGSSLIEKARLQSVTQEFGQISTAVQAFKGSYNGLPGDLGNGASFFTGSCQSGNGDGVISDVIVGGSSTIEAYCAWNHLAISGTLSGHLHNNYQGTYVDVGNTSPVLGKDIPESKLQGAGYFFHSYNNKNYVVLSAITTSTNPTAIITPRQALTITKKIGPAAGREGGGVLAINDNNATGPSGTPTNDCHDISEYSNLSSDDNKCSLAQEIG